MKSILNFFRKKLHSIFLYLMGYPSLASSKEENDINDFIKNTKFDKPTQRTSTSVPSKIIIKSNGMAVGAIQNLTIREFKGNGNIFTITGTCGRVRFDKLNISEAFCGKKHIANEDFSTFDIEIVDTNCGEILITTLKNCFIREMSYSYAVDSWMILENMSFEAESIETLKYQKDTKTPELNYYEIKKSE